MSGHADVLQARWIAWATLNVADMPASDSPAVRRVLAGCLARGDLEEMYHRARVIVAHQREPLRSIRNCRHLPAGARTALSAAKDKE